MSDIIGLSNVIILLATLLVISYYAYETYRLRKINVKIYDLEKEKLEPNVIAYFDYNPKAHELIFRVKNIGGGIAKNILINISPDLNFGDGTIEKHIIFNKENRIIPILPPNKEFSAIIGYSVLASKKYLKKEIPVEYYVKINFLNSIDKKYFIDMTLSIHNLFWRILEKDYLIEELENTNKILSKINKNLENKS